MTKLYIAVPCYNEEEVLPDSSGKLCAKMQKMMAQGKITEDSRIVFIDDGSKDKTWEIISKLHSENEIYQGIKLHAIKFKLDINKVRFESERFDIEQHQNQNNANSGNTNIYDSLTNIGGTATKDPEANKNFDNETPEV